MPACESKVVSRSSRRPQWLRLSRPGASSAGLGFN